ncbi:MAG TPA: glycosyltransferase family 39 protein [Acidobacteriaceae bacterium]
MQERHNWYRWGSALVAGAVLRLIFFHFRPHLSGDSQMYGELAHNMLAHHVYGFSETTLLPTLIRLPGYPLFLAACFLAFGNGNYLAVILIQMVIDLAGCALLGGLAGRLWGRRAGLIALWLAALCPFTANYSVIPLTETMSLFCVALGFFALERWDADWRIRKSGLRWAIVTGCALSFAVLVRPDQGLLAAAIVPAMLWVGLKRKGQKLVRRLLPAAVATLIMVLPLLAWTARNWRTFHVIQPLAPRYANDPGEDVPVGFQRWYRTWAIDYKSTFDVYWNYDDAQLNLSDLPGRAFDNAEQLAQTRALFTQYNKVTSATPEFDQAFARIAAERIAAHPLRYYVVMPVARELNMWLRPRTELMQLPIQWWAIESHPAESAAEIAYGLLNAAYLGLAIAGIFCWRTRRWGGRGALAFAMLSLVVTRCLLLLTIDNSEPRYTLECFPIVILLASLALLRQSIALSD